MRADSFRDFVLDQLAGIQGVACRPMFGGHGLYRGETFFGIIHKGRLYLKTDEASREKYRAEGMKPFRPTPRQTLKSYFEVPAGILEDGEKLAAWADKASRPEPELDFQPVTPGRWGDIERLFGERGACGGCWCMWWRLPRSEYEKSRGERNRKSFRRLVRSDEPPGLIAYAGGAPAGWIALAPREAYAGLERSRTLARVDARPVWSIVCFFVARPFRRQGLSVKLLEAAADYARKRGARILEGYPVEPSKGRMPDAFAWTGTAAAFRKAGFAEAERRSATRPIMRRALL